MPTGPKGQKRPRDANQLAKLIVDIATGQVEDREPTSGVHIKTTKDVGDKKPPKLTPHVELTRKKSQSPSQNNPGSN